MKLIFDFIEYYCQPQTTKIWVINYFVNIRIKKEQNDIPRMYPLVLKFINLFCTEFPFVYNDFFVQLLLYHDFPT